MPTSFAATQLLQKLTRREQPSAFATPRFRFPRLVLGPREPLPQPTATGLANRRQRHPIHKLVIGQHLAFRSLDIECWLEREGAQDRPVSQTLGGFLDVHDFTA
jgi:hypothetical protein